MEHNNSSPNLKNSFYKQNIDLTSLISIELNKIDTNEIKNLVYSLVKNLTEKQETYIYNLCIKIQEIKKGIIYKVYKYIKEKNQNEIIKENSSNDSIINELKNLNKYSKIKFKQFDTFMTVDFENNFKKLNEFIKKGKIQHSLNQINILDDIRIQLKNSVQEMQTLQNNYLNNCSEILKTNIVGMVKSKSQRKFMVRSNTPSMRNTRSNSRKSLSPNYLNTSLNYEKKNNYEEKENKDKTKDKKSEIENLKELLLKEKEYKNQILRELNNLKYFKKFCDISKFKNLIVKINKLSEMVISFTNSLRNIRESIYRKSIDDFETKKIYKQLLKTLNEIINLNLETKQLESKILNNDENQKKLETSIDLSMENEDTLKEIKLKAQNKLNKLGNNKNKIPPLNINKTNVNNNNIINNNKINEYYNDKNIEKVISFRDKNIDNSDLKNGGELEDSIENINENNTNINENNIEKLLTENKNLKSQIASLILSQETKNLTLNKIDEEIRKENENLKKELEEKEMIIQKNSNQKLENNGQNLSDDERTLFETEIMFLKSEINRLESESRTQNIVTNIDLNNYQNENLELEVEIENLKKEIEELKSINSNIKIETESRNSDNNSINNNNKISNDNNNSNNLIDNNLVEKLELTIKNLNKELEEKTDELNTLNASYQSDLNELNASIIVLKTKVEKLEEENLILSSNNKSKDNNDSGQNIEFKSYSFHLTYISRVINNEKEEEIKFLTKKNQCLIDDNKNLCDLVQDLKTNKKKEKEQLISLIKGSFEKFLSETKIDNKNKEFLVIFLKILNYSDEDINYMLSIIGGKKKGKVLGFFSGK